MDSNDDSSCAYSSIKALVEEDILTGKAVRFHRMRNYDLESDQASRIKTKDKSNTGQN